LYFAVHTGRRTVDHNLWPQWQELASLWNPAAPDSQTRFGLEGTFGLGSFTEAAARFTAAARSFLDGAANAPAAGEAARAFSDFLREQFTEFRFPWSLGIGAGAAHGAP